MRQLTKEKLQGSRFESKLINTFGVTVASVFLYFIELAEVVVISLAIILPIRYFLVQPFYVKGASMEPNFNDHEYLIIDELSYRFRQPVRGEIVVFRSPTDPRQYFIKRVIGLPGETVEVANGQVKIYTREEPLGFTLNESYIDIRTEREGLTKLGVDQYYLMGDNRPLSLDSRVFGPVERSAIVGKVWIRGWPLNKVTVFEAPSY